MLRTIQRIRTTAFIVSIVELVLSLVFLFFYFANFFNFKDLIKPAYVILGACILIIVDCIFVWIIIIVFGSLRHKTDLKAAQVIGSDIQEAYNFAMIGLVVTSEEDIVLWTNDLFEERHIDILDNNIFDWKPELRSLKDTNDPNATIELNINSKTYSIKYLREAGLFIFKDISQYTDLFTFSQNQAPVVGLLSLDNYNDVVKTEDDFNDLVSKVKNEIFEYVKTYGILLRRYRNDTYFMLFNFETLEKIRKDNFSLLDRAREQGRDESIPITLSLGIAYNFPSIVKLDELAEQALSIAMSRGGDQVVVAKYGFDMEFLGGKSETKEKRSRVKARVFADSLISLIKSSDNVLVMGHAMMDMDALGACLGIKAICERFDKACKVVVDFRNTEPKTRAAITSTFSKDELDKLIVQPKAAHDQLNSNTLMVVVDAHIQKMTMEPSLLDKANKVVVIDHHRRMEDYIEAPVLNHIEPSASSTCEILAEFISFASAQPKISLNSVYATIMLSGIYLDSNCFKSKSTGMRTFEAASILKEFGADTTTADDYLKDDYEEHELINNILHNLKTICPGVVYCVADGNDVIYDSATLAKTANACLSFKGNNAAFVLGRTGNREYKMSARSDGSVNVSFLMEKLGGGGHFTSAAATFNNEDPIEIIHKLEKTLDVYLQEAKIDVKNKG